LIRAAAQLEARDGEGRTPLHVAVQQDDNDDVVAGLLAAGADPNALDERRSPPLDRAVSVRTEALLLRAGARPRDALHSQAEAVGEKLMAAIERDDEEAFADALESGADLGFRDSFGRTPLLSAVEQNRTHMVTRLLDAGADVNASHGVFGYASLHIAGREGAEAMIRLLLERGASVDLVTLERHTVLHAAASGGVVWFAQLLLERGAALDARGEGGETPLHLAAGSGHRAMVDLLLDRGADLEARNSVGDTPLLEALNGYRLRDDDAQVAARLIERGANVGARSERTDEERVRSRLEEMRRLLKRSKT
jgi:cytohesin